MWWRFWKGKGADHGREGIKSWPRNSDQGGETRAYMFWVMQVVFACLTLLTLAFVSGLSRPFFSSAYQGVSLPQQQQRQQQQQTESPLFPPPASPKNLFPPPAPPKRLFPPPSSPKNLFPPPAAPKRLFPPPSSPKNLIPPPANPKYLDGLLAAGFDEDSCRSRYQAGAYRKPSPHKPSLYLVERLRRYEKHHHRCAPGTAAYKTALRLLDLDTAPLANATGCRYVLWSPAGGLGNQIMSLASTFLYALLTDRVLLINPDKNLNSLFCEPFPSTTWLLPQGFPVTRFDEFKKENNQSYAVLLKNKKIRNDVASGGPRPPTFLFVYLGDDYGTEEMYFFCERDQATIHTVPWLLLKSDLYFVPPLFLNEGFEPELIRLFPEKETVFHHLGRYLFHPTNEVWGMVLSYYWHHLAEANMRLGVQIRVFSRTAAPFEVVSKQVVDCLQKEKLLPAVDSNFPPPPASLAIKPNKTMAVLITSLDSGYFEKIRSMYWEHPTEGGVAVTVHQPSHEGRQRTGMKRHDEKAWAEINLLSLADVLVTSAWSTFGYVAQGLAGIRPWVLVRMTKRTMPEPTCFRDVSMEPCLHKPPWYVCRKRRIGDNAKVVPYVTHCPDVKSGLKLIDQL